MRPVFRISGIFEVQISVFEVVNVGQAPLAKLTIRVADVDGFAGLVSGEFGTFGGFVVVPWAVARGNTQRFSIYATEVIYPCKQGCGVKGEL